MSSALRLTLLVGPAVPLPAPPEVLECLESVDVQSGSGEAQSGFELTFRLPARSPLTTLFLVSGGASIPFVRVVVVVTAGGMSEVLIDGVMTHHELVPGSAAGQASLVVKGKDLSALMDLRDGDGTAFPGCSPPLRVLAILAKYAAFGVIPLVIPTVVEDTPDPTEKIPAQQGTDYAYVKQLAHEAGHVFYIEPGPSPGMSRAYWGPEIKVGMPQPAINGDMDAHSNAESLTFSFDKEKKEMPIVFIQQKEAKTTLEIPIPDITPLNPPLGVVPPLPPKMTKLSHTAKMSPARAVMTGLAYAARHSDALTATGTLDYARYGHVLKSRRLVGVRGAGEAFDGLYYVNSVRHTLKRGQYKQSFTLGRNGFLSTVQAVPP